MEPYIQTFAEMELNTAIEKNLTVQGFKIPSEIQKQVFLPFIQGKDIIGCSKTGSGKTLAYLLPVLKRADAFEGIHSIIISPTYELNLQIMHQLKELIQHTGIQCVLLNGDGNLQRQTAALKEKKPQIIVGSAGRIRQLIKEKKIKCHTVQTLILDEADKLLDKNNLELILEIRKCLLKYTQVCLFSASMDEKAIRQAGQFMTAPLVFHLNAKDKKEENFTRIPSSITHLYVICERNSRIETLRSLCAAVQPSKCIMFSNNSYELNKIFDKLSYHGYNIDSLCGNASKAQRKMAVSDFREGRLQYLLSTDIAARGLHFEKISHIINITLPEEINEYLHRAGRCGRNKETGVCISLITLNELKRIQDIQKRFKIQIQPAILKKGVLSVKS